MAYFIGGWVVVVFSVVAIREFRRRRLLRPLRDAQEGDPVLLRTSVTLKLDPSVLAAPRWALGAAGFVLTVRPNAFSVVGPGPTQSWYFKASDATIQADRTRTPWGTLRDWIVVSATDLGKPVRLSISPFPKNHVGDAWSALVTAGVTPLSDPPPG
jgi:hypothetical protein